MRHFAVVGSGPAGFYTAEALEKAYGGEARIDILDRYPVPYGLIRFGVAPDHQSLKAVSKRYDKVAESAGVDFIGNVSVGRDASVAELLDLYDAVVLATGAPHDRKLGIPGEDLPGSHAATEFVAWYNGHPDFADREFDLGCERVVVIGNGNVAADVARMLLLPRPELECTDTAPYAIDALAGSSVREVLVLGRRGPAQAAFTNPEVRELGELTDADVFVDRAAVAADETSAAFLDSDAADATNRKNLESFTEFSEREPGGKPKRVELRFLRTPLEIQGDGRVERIVAAVNRLEVDESGAVRARATDETETIECGMVLRSIGYLGTGIDGVPYDAAAGVIPNERGRVTGDGSKPHPGHYVVGWIKRGPTGVIGTNKKDAQETIETLLEDAAAGTLPERDAGADALPALLAGRGVDFIEYDGWQEIDALEQERGAAAGRPRIKLTAFEELLAAARKERNG